MAKVLFQIRGAEREQLERMFRDLVALQGAFQALVNSIAGREKIPQDASFDANKMRFTPKEG